VALSDRNHDRDRAQRWRRPAAGVATIGGLLALTATALPGAAVAAQGTKSKSATVVQVVTRTADGMTFSDMLATVPGRSLYVDTNASPCTGGCLTVWPPLFMPKGKTVALGASGLGTVKAGKHRQVTLDGKRLYMFDDDSGTSVNGENVGGFVVAQEP
jgi:predicted lipoprotein with Yx(FWY)xxD motif